MDEYSLLCQELALFVEVRDQVLHTPIEGFGFGGLRCQLMFEVGEAAAEGFGLGALFGELAVGLVSLGGVACETVVQLLYSLRARSFRSDR